MADELMTTQELQELLRVDRTTVYAMLKEGRLPGFKVGGRWRFSRRDVESWLHEQQENPGDELPVVPSPNVLPLETIQSIQAIFAEGMGIGAVVTRLDGRPLTQLSNSCRFCQIVRRTPEGMQACINSWGGLAGQKERRPRLVPCHAGLLYARSRIEVEDEFVAMVFAGEFLIEDRRSDLEARLPAVAEAARVEVDELRTALETVHNLSEAQAERLMDLLARLGMALSVIGRERLLLLRKLRQISEVSSLEWV